MLNDSRSHLFDAPTWCSFRCGGHAHVLSFNFIGDALPDYLDPRRVSKPDCNCADKRRFVVGVISDTHGLSPEACKRSAAATTLFMRATRDRRFSLS